MQWESYGASSGDSWKLYGEQSTVGAVWGLVAGRLYTFIGASEGLMRANGGWQGLLGARRG